MTDAALMAVAAHCSAFHSLYLYMHCFSEFTDAGLAAVVRGYPELQHVSVTGVKAITHKGITNLGGE
ncbi:hypothetical protein B484DRAFT_406651 [Ochromonadaceae sp. CCMP2298]|nr:hypothetical protein B484DRAFT_406651 [Ochromonadaceae sp. CCMP2298]